MERVRGSVLLGSLVGALTACGPPDAPGGGIAAAPVPLAPADFAIERCAGVADGDPCLIARAGGKTVLVGAPEGAMNALEAIGVIEPDIILIQTLDPSGIDGLSRLRNRSWALGRTLPLRLAGPDGTDLLARGLDAALARSDAFVYLTARPAGAFDSAPFQAVAVPPGAIARVFDTGDLQVDALAEPGGALTYHIRYGGKVLQVRPCKAPARTDQALIPDAYLDCGAASRSEGWPFAQPRHLISQPDKGSPLDPDDMEMP